MQKACVLFCYENNQQGSALIFFFFEICCSQNKCVSMPQCGSFFNACVVIGFVMRHVQFRHLYHKRNEGKIYILTNFIITFALENKNKLLAINEFMYASFKDLYL